MNDTKRQTNDRITHAFDRICSLESKVYTDFEKDYKPPTPALPPDDKRCIQIQDVQRCLNEATDGHKIYCECGHNFGPDSIPPDHKRCELMSDDDPPRRCQNPRLVVRHCGNVGQCYFGPESKPAPKPPPPPENVTTKGVLLRKICPNCDHYVSRCICEPLPASTACPARVPVFGMEAVTIANAALTSWHADSTANLEQLCVEVVRATEKHHGITT